MTDQLILDQEMGKILRLECEISEYLAKTNNCFTHFEYFQEADGSEQIIMGLKIITYNRVHQKAFLLKEFKGEDRETILLTALQYLKETIKTEKNYTVYWSELPTGKNYISYFHGIDINEVKCKLYCSVENIQNIQITEIKLSPSS